jgi:hypothetical protein
MSRGFSAELEMISEDIKEAASPGGKKPCNSMLQVCRPVHDHVQRNGHRFGWREHKETSVRFGFVPESNPFDTRLLTTERRETAHIPLPNQAWLRQYVKARVPELLIEAQSSVPVQHHCLDEPAQLSHRFVDQELAFSQNLEFGILGQ